MRAYWPPEISGRVREGETKGGGEREKRREEKSSVHKTMSLSPQQIKPPYPLFISNPPQIFFLGDIVSLAGGNFSELSIRGGVISISIQWKCNLVTKKASP